MTTMNKKLIAEEKRIAKEAQKLQKEEKRLNGKLVRAVAKTGLSWAAYSSIIEIGDNILGTPVDTACWYYNKATKQERIFISTRFVRDLNVAQIALVLKHEFLHKSMYRNIQGVSNHFLINLCLDAAINKILFLSDPKGMAKLSQYLYDEKKGCSDKFGIFSLVNCSITNKERERIVRNLKDLFDEIYIVKWQKQTFDSNGNRVRLPQEDTSYDYMQGGNRNNYKINKFIPDPLTLYNKLSICLTAEQKRKIEEAYSHLQEIEGRSSDDITDGSDDSSPSDEGQDKTEKLDKQIDDDNKSNDTDKIKNRVWVRGYKGKLRNEKKDTLKKEKNIVDSVVCSANYSNKYDLEAYFEKHVYFKKKSDKHGLMDFVKRWETQKLLDEVCQNIYGQLRTQTVIEPYPQELSRLGLEMVVAGISGYEDTQIPIFFNNLNEGSGKKKVCFYFDTSPSMHSFIPHMIYIVDFLSGCDELELVGGDFEGKYTFSETVKGVPPEEWDSFKNGENVRGGYGTSFETVIRHSLDNIDNDTVDIAVIFTDGYSNISDETIDEFNVTDKKCYNIYFAQPGGYYSYSHSRSGTEVDDYQMTSDLDKLKGESFTIKCNPDDFK